LIWIGASVIAIIALTFLLFKPTSIGSVDKNQPVGRASFDDFNSTMDKIDITTSGLPEPKPGSHYQVWYLGEGGETRRNIGPLSMKDGEGQLSFNHPDQENLLGLFDQLEVTIESNNDPNPNASSGEVMASSVFPPQSLIHVRHLLVSFKDAPDGEALILGLWNTADEVDNSAIELNQAFDDGDETLFRLKNEEIINQLVGSANTLQYRDWNEDGTINSNTDKYGLLANGPDNSLGYIPNSINHAQYAAEAADATDNIQIHSMHVVVCIENMRGWSEQLLDKALQLQAMPFGSDMEPLVKEIRLLSNQVLFGVDTNSNGLIEPILGEGGGGTVYEHAYFMAQMPLLLGKHRIPSPAVIK
jgi:hypothetical protein